MNSARYPPNLLRNIGFDQEVCMYQPQTFIIFKFRQQFLHTPKQTFCIQFQTLNLLALVAKTSLSMLSNAKFEPIDKTSSNIKVWSWMWVRQGKSKLLNSNFSWKWMSTYQNFLRRIQAFCVWLMLHVDAICNRFACLKFRWSSGNPKLVELELIGIEVYDFHHF